MDGQYCRLGLVVWESQEVQDLRRQQGLFYHRFLLNDGDTFLAPRILPTVLQEVCFQLN